MQDQNNPICLDFRTLALSLPKSAEQDHFGAPSFRVEGKIFAQLSADGAEALVKLPMAIQEGLLLTTPDQARAEPQWGRYGWTRLIWARYSEAELTDFLTLSWRAVAPKALVGLLPATKP